MPCEARSLRNSWWQARTALSGGYVWWWGAPSLYPCLNVWAHPNAQNTTIEVVSLGIVQHHPIQSKPPK
eukprot:6208913-Prorocentrum_lima.AAC.1